jgi:hypothetical protein
MERQIVYVLSTNYAGSHFLALQLASHSRCASVGEFHRYRRPAATRRQACSICPDDEQCPVYRGLDEVPLRQLFDRVFANVQAVNPQVTALIDNSKKPDWAARFLDLEGFRQRYVHLVRDPRALVRRWMLCYETPAAKGKVRRLTARRCWPHLLSILRGPEDNVYVHKWAYQNRLISRFIRKNHLDARVITYQDLVQFPERILGDLMGWLGLEFEPRQLEYWTVTHHGSQKPEYMKAPAGGGRFHDLRWQQYLSPEAQQRIPAHPEVRRYLAELGITLNASGLTLHPEWYQPAPARSGVP